MTRAARAGLTLAALLSCRVASAAPSVWVIDDGEKIKEDATNLRFETGEDNPVWSPGQPVRLFALRGETVALQVVVEADDEALDGVTVDLDELRGPAGARIADTSETSDPSRFVGRDIERFVEHFFEVKRPSGNEMEPRESIGWRAGSGPPAGKWTGSLPDALIPVEVSPRWRPYPLHVAPRRNGIVWIDVTVPASQPPGAYAGAISVASQRKVLAEIPVELEVVDAELPAHPVKTMLFYDRSELNRRIGGADRTEEFLWQLFHRHRLTAMHAAVDLPELERHLPALDGSAFTAAHGYQGAGEGQGDDVLALGAYGDLGAPSESGRAFVESAARTLAARGLLKKADVFVYAKDEDCKSPYGKAWKELLAESVEPLVKQVRVGWTCSEEPSSQPVDIPIQLETFDPRKAMAARERGKDVWVYNGVRPFDGTFLTDSEAVSLRANGWLEAMFGAGRWFYWETTLWYDGTKGQGAFDPFATPETFHNKDGDFCMGDGVLVYPGVQKDVGTEHSLGWPFVIASIRLKNWRRGIEDAGYYLLARGADAKAADAIASALLPRVFTGARAGEPPSWSDVGARWYEARKALLALIPRGRGAAKSLPVGPESPGPSDGGGPSWRGAALGVIGLVAAAGVLWATMRRSRRGPPPRPSPRGAGGG